MENTLRGKLCWVTGAGSGIGRCLALALAEQGATVILSGRNLEKLQAVQQQSQTPERFHCLPCDVTMPEQIIRTANDINKYGTLDILINNAGIGTFAPLIQLSEQDIISTLQTNLLAPLICSKAVLPGMIERNSGTILNILSVAAVTAFQGATAYAASKAGLLAASASLRAEVRSSGIKIIDVLPGATATDIWSEDMLQQFSERMMSPESVAKSVVTLLQLPADIMPEQTVLRPQLGDL